MHNPDFQGIPALKRIPVFHLLLISIIILCNPINLLSKGSVTVQEEYYPENISSFIVRLVDSGEYYRAHTELDRLVCYYPEYITPLCYNVTNSYILFKSGRFHDLLIEDMDNDDTVSLCRLNIFKIDCLLKPGLYNDERLGRLLNEQNCNENDFAEYYKKRYIYYYIVKFFYDDSDFIFSDNMEYRDSFVYGESISEQKKSPFLGAVAGIIPGLGYIYAGEAGTGIVAFIIIAAGSAITWGAHSNHLEPVAAVSGAATFFMYTGSIAGGYMQTLKYNRGLSEKLVLRLDKDFMLDKDIDDIYIKFGIKSNVR